MRIWTFLTVISLTAFSAIAEARPRTDADDAIVARLLSDADKVSAILEKDLDHPKAALKKLDKLMKKRRKPMKKAVAQLAAVAGELDDDARADLRTELFWGAQTARFLQALTAFQEKWGEDPLYQPRIERYMEELMTDGKLLFDALVK
jgi:hypothetical protein